MPVTNTDMTFYYFLILEVRAVCGNPNSSCPITRNEELSEKLELLLAAKCLVSLCKKNQTAP